MAVQRVTSDNTARYVRACFGWGLALIAIGAIASWLLPHVGDPQARWSPYVVAGMFGVLGAVFSVATRTEALKLRPCDESSMNVWMAAVRVVIGVTSAIALLLFADTLLTDMFGKIAGLNGGKFSTYPTGRDDLIFWPTVALLGFVGGFAERLIPNILRQTTDQIQSSAGTPVQLARTLPRKSVQNGSSGTTSP